MLATSAAQKIQKNGGVLCGLLPCSARQRVYLAPQCSNMTASDFRSKTAGVLPVTPAHAAWALGPSRMTLIRHHLADVAAKAASGQTVFSNATGPPPAPTQQRHNKQSDSPNALDAACNNNNECWGRHAGAAKGLAAATTLSVSVGFSSSMNAIYHQNNDDGDDGGLCGLSTARYTVPVV